MVPLAVADAVALVVFVLVSIRTHHEIGALRPFPAKHRGPDELRRRLERDSIAP
jgi:hypothetical protein